ncbi:MAG: mechanosensitive ion channel family protein [Starkeya sp.]|nr:mechanosensitive ion channel family protein [Starkeya sp.]
MFSSFSPAVSSATARRTAAPRQVLIVLPVVPLLARLMLAALVALVVLVGAGAGFAQIPPEQQQVQEKLEGQRAIVDGVEAALGRDGLRSSDLDDLRARLDPVRADLATGVAALDPLLANLNHRVKEIGPKPADDAPAESASITAERDALSARAAELDAVLKQAKLLKVRADQLSDRITSRRRALFTDQLLARSYSVLDPSLWLAAAAAVPIELRGVNYLLSDWAAYANARMQPIGQIAIGLASLLIVGLIFVARSVLARPIRRAELGVDGAPISRLRACSLSALVAILRMAAGPLAATAVLALLNGFDLLPSRVNEIAQGLLLAISIVAIGVGLLDGALAPREPQRRVVPLSNEIAGLIFRFASIGLWILAVAVTLGAFHRALVVPVPLSVATSAAMSLCLVLVASRSMRALNALSGDGDEDITDAKAGAAKETTAPTADAGEVPSTSVLNWIKFPFWILNLTVVGALVIGYVSFAGFLSSRALIAVVMAGTLYLVVALINSLFIDALATGPRARHAAKLIGVRPASLELLAVLTAGLLKAVAIIGIVILTVGTFGTSTSDLADIASRVTLGFTIGNSTVAIGDILSALLFLAVGIVIARAIQRWFAVAILPKTAFDQGLQNSIATIIGYIGSITVIAMAMGQLGLNLENIALVAGALSVGIGFGLQSIVSNFVSGLILLAERPIRVGDTIAVKGEEGYVRRISVRATEIETFDRAAVLIPNSDLITGMVKNFTHANTTGRVIVAVNVAYDADADEVRDILIGCACDHPQVLRSPPPRVFLMAFGDSYLKFELRCVVANVDYALTVKSDLHFAVLDRLKAAKIGIPYTPWSIYRGGRIGEEPAAGDDGA